MTTADRLRTFWGERELNREGLGSLVTRYWEIAIFAALMLVALGLRLPDLAGRAIHHDESLHMIYSWQLFDGRGYTHVPFMHGPFQYFGSALVFRLWPFGATDFSGRLLYVLFGVALVGLPYFLRSYIGRKGAIIAAVFLAVSPTLWYFSRFARNDIYIAFFTLATVIVIWRYLKEQKQVLLYALPLLLMLGFTTKEVTFITVAIFLAYLEVQLATDLVDRMRASRSMEPWEIALAYVVLLPTAWLIACLWPLLGEPRKRWSLTTLPPAGHLLIIMGTFSIPQFGPAVQKIPEFIGNAPGIGDNIVSFLHIDALRDRNVDAEAWSMLEDEQALRLTTVLLAVIGSAAVGLLWNPRVWGIGAAIFYIPFFLLYTTFFTNGGDIWNPSGEFWSGEGGFWTGIWGSLDYWLSQQLVRRGSQPDYYYFVLLPVYEFLPLVFALGGALFYALRGRLEQVLATVSALLLVVLFIGLPDDTRFIGEYRIQASFLVVIATVLLLSMDGFTKFLLFWALATLFGITVAGEKMPWLTVHLAVPIALLAAKVLDDVLSTVGVEPGEAERRPRRARGERRRREPEPGFTPNPLLSLILAATFAVLAAIVFQFVGPAKPLSALAWFLSLATLGIVVSAGTSISWHAAGQAAAVSLAAAFLVFTVRAGAIAAYDQGNSEGTPQELLIYAQGSPGLTIVIDNIQELAFGPGGPGHDQKIVIDNTSNIWPWPWSLREYDKHGSLQYDNFEEETFTPEPGSVVLISNQNQAKIEASLDQFHPGIPYTHMWWFPERYRGLEVGSFLADFFRGRYLSTWRMYFIDRELKDAYASHDMLAFFPKEFQPDIPTPPDIPGAPTTIPAESQTVIGGLGQGPGQFSQPADLALDADGNLYVVDTLNHRVQRFTLDGTFIDAVGEQGTGEGQFFNPGEGEEFAPDGPWGVAVDADGNVYVADTWNHRIQKFSPEFEFLLEWGVGELFGPRDIAVDDEGNVLVVDTGNKRIIKYTPDGEQIEVYGQEGDGPGEFNEPTGLSIAPDGDIYVADFWNRRIQHFDSDFGYIDEISVGTWGGEGIADRGAHVIALEDGRVLATDPANGRIVVFDREGEEQAAWRFSTAPSRPVGIAVDALGRVYVADGLASEVRRVPLLALLP